MESDRTEHLAESAERTAVQQPPTPPDHNWPARRWLAGVVLLTVIAAVIIGLPSFSNPPKGQGLAESSARLTNGLPQPSSSQPQPNSRRLCGLVGQEYTCGHADGYSFGYDAASVATDYCNSQTVDVSYFPSYGTFDADADYNSGLNQGWVDQINECLSLGMLCSSPDCLFDEMSGEWRYLIGWAECVVALDEGLCSDLDDDGVAGYPDSG